MIRTSIAFALAVAVWSMQPSETLLERVCRFLKIDPKIYKKLTSVRGTEHEGIGQRLMVADLERRRTSELWNCSGCWSPIIVSMGQLAVAKSDGIWVVSRDGQQAKLVVPASNITRLVGVIPEKGRLVLALTVEGGGTDALYSPVVADLDHGLLKAAPTELAKGFREAEILYFPRPDRFRVFPQPDGTRIGKFISASATRPRYLLTSTLPEGERAHLSENTDLLPWLNSKGMVERFDPIWLSDREVAFLEAP
jgi:hypothetical protein